MLPPSYNEALRLTGEGDFESALDAWDIHYRALTPETEAIERFFTHYYLADALSETENYERALRLFRKALDEVPPGEEDLRISVQVEICRLLMEQSEYAAADALRVEIWPDLLNRNRLHEAYYTALDKYVQNQDDGDRLLNQVMRRAVENRRADFLFHQYRDLAAHLLAHKRFDELVEFSKSVRSLLLATQNGDDFRATIAYTCLNELEVYYQKQEYDLLEARLIDFKDILSEPPEGEERVTSLRLFYDGVRALIQGEVERSLKIFSKLESTARYDENFHLVVLEKSFQALADFYYYDEALPIAERAVEMATIAENEYAQLDITVDIAQILDGSNRFGHCAKVLQPIEDRVLAYNDAELIQRFYALLTKAAEQMPDARLFEHARMHWNEFGSQLPDHLAFDFCFEYAQTLLNLNLVERAMEMYDRAEQIAVEQGWTHNLPFITVEKAICEAKLNAYQDSYDRLRAMQPPEQTIHLYATYLNLLADCQQELGERERAITNYKKVIDLIGEHPHLFHYASSAYSNLGLIEHLDKNYPGAEALYLQGLEVDRKSKISQQEITALYNLGVLYIDWDHPEKAEPYLWAALDLLTNTFGATDTPTERKYLSDEWFTLIELLVEVFIARGDEWNALRLLLNKEEALSGLARNKIEQLPLPRLNPDQSILAYSGIRQERFFVFQLSVDRRQKSPCLKVLRQELNEIAREDISVSLLEALEIFQKRTLRSPGERDKNYQSPYPWMIRYAHFLAAQPERFQSPAKINLKNELFSLLSKVLLPLPLKLAGLRELIISPNYILGALPFGALFAEAEESTRLIEAFDLSIYGGIHTSEPERKNDKSALIFGATRYPSDFGLADLSAGDAEIEVIKKILPASISTVNDPSQDILEQVNLYIKRVQPAYLHYLGHLESRYPESVLHYPSAPGGIITVSELRSLKLRGTNVFVSACSGADGAAYAGWGVDSVALAFLNAGASTVISMLFPLSDRLSPLLVEQIYRLTKAGASTGAALSEVQRSCVSGQFGHQYQAIQCWGSLLCVNRFAAQF
ncbi:hypothetical protein CEQ90_04515 [Lewinellaceae bacterium SD302]|nr:hypothetical protein CEQ90_04515 [Lewinellaceae bacterium SD302]